MWQPSVVAAVALAVSGVSGALTDSVHVAARKSRAFLSQDARMQPDVVAHTLVKVENEWMQQAARYARCDPQYAEQDETCLQAVKGFKASCSKVVGAVKAASAGDRSVVRQYMSNVCDQPELQGWREERCRTLGGMVASAMTADNYENREELSPVSVCHSFWSRVLIDERARVRKEEAEKAAREKKIAEEKREEAEKAAKRAAEEMKREKEEEKKQEERRKLEKEAEKQREEAAKQRAAQEKRRQEAEEARHKAEEAAKRLAEKRAEVEREAQEAKAKAEEAAQKLAEKRAEAEHEAEIAKKKMEEAQAAEMQANKTLRDLKNENTTEAKVSGKEKPKVAAAAQATKTEAAVAAAKVKADNTTALHAAKPPAVVASTPTEHSTSKPVVSAAVVPNKASATAANATKTTKKK